MTTRILTTVEAKGSVHTSFDLAEFSVTISECAQERKTVQAELSTSVQRLLRCVDRLKTQGMTVELGSFRVPRSTIDKQERYEDGARRFDGYKASYQLLWSTPTLHMVNDIYNQLLSIEVHELDVLVPRFSLRDPESFKASALALAWAKADALFENELRTLGNERLGIGRGSAREREPSVLSWQVGYDGYVRDMTIGLTGPTGPLGAAGPTGPSSDHPVEILEIHPGRAVVTVALRVTYGFLDT